MNALTLLGTGLIKKEKKPKVGVKLTKSQKCAREIKRAASVETFLREVLGTHLIQMEKKI
jgi:hypothetical protein